MSAHFIVAAGSVHWFTGWQFTGHFTTVNLIAASTNALNGALLARRPDHYKNFTRVGILAMALLGGLTGGGFVSWVLGRVDPGFGNQTTVTLPDRPGMGQYVMVWDRPQW